SHLGFDVANGVIHRHQRLFPSHLQTLEVLAVRRTDHEANSIARGRAGGPDVGELIEPALVIEVSPTLAPESLTLAGFADQRIDGIVWVRADEVRWRVAPIPSGQIESGIIRRSAGQEGNLPPSRACDTPWRSRHARWLSASGQV